MSGRALDSVFYGGENYAILHKGSREGLFDPRQFAIMPGVLHTGAYHGFICQYTVTDETLLLSSLQIRAKDGTYPLINEVRPSFPELSSLGDYESEFYAQQEVRNARGEIAWHLDSHAFYGEIKMPTPYTGTLRIGRDTLPAYYRGFLPGWLDWMHRTVFDLDFAAGRLQASTDLSAQMASIREKEQTAEEFSASSSRRRFEQAQKKPNE